ncbi:hypothetical protein [Salinivibrio sp. KP-1]|nr:hypothetical protein [Salinivibrio sp. KP-1]
MTPVFHNAKDGIVQTFAAFFISASLEEAATLADMRQAQSTTAPEHS